MIRIIDEPVYEMSKAEYERLRQEFYSDPGFYGGLDMPYGTPAEEAKQFEVWLEHAERWPSTKQGGVRP
jgi:hypothetical protein